MSVVTVGLESATDEKKYVVEYVVALIADDVTVAGATDGATATVVTSADDAWPAVDAVVWKYGGWMETNDEKLIDDENSPADDETVRVFVEYVVGDAGSNDEVELKLKTAEMNVVVEKTAIEDDATETKEERNGRMVADDVTAEYVTEIAETKDDESEVNDVSTKTNEAIVVKNDEMIERNDVTIVNYDAHRE